MKKNNIYKIITVAVVATGTFGLSDVNAFAKTHPSTRAKLEKTVKLSHARKVRGKNGVIYSNYHLNHAISNLKKHKHTVFKTNRKYVIKNQRGKKQTYSLIKSKKLKGVVLSHKLRLVKVTKAKHHAKQQSTTHNTSTTTNNNSTLNGENPQTPSSTAVNPTINQGVGYDQASQTSANSTLNKTSYTGDPNASTGSGTSTVVTTTPMGMTGTSVTSDSSNGSSSAGVLSHASSTANNSNGSSKAVNSANSASTKSSESSRAASATNGSNNSSKAANSASSSNNSNGSAKVSNAANAGNNAANTAASTTSQTSKSSDQSNNSKTASKASNSASSSTKASSAASKSNQNSSSASSSTKASSAASKSNQNINSASSSAKSASNASNASNNSSSTSSAASSASNSELAKYFTGDEIKQINAYKSEAAAIGNGNSDSDVYDTKPNVNGTFSVGKLNQNYIDNSIKWINFFRKMVGMNPVSENSSWSTESQYGANLLNAVNTYNDFDNYIAHNISAVYKPPFMSDQDWNRGIAATSTSNISATSNGENPSPYDVVTQYLNDGNNIKAQDGPGHREWLTGNIDSIGIGLSGNFSDYKIYNSSNSEHDFNTNVNHPVNFPGNNLYPINLVQGTPWSVSVPTNFNNTTVKPTVTVYDNTDKRAVSVTNTNINGTIVSGGVNFNGVIEGSTYAYGSGYFGSNVWFTPDANAIKVNHSYTITIKNLPGYSQPYTYTTKLFDLGIK
ncbi:hypothetical protein MOO44_02785 [Nicoliella spurrieriana]|uniref:SCP domain-containing protein n=1 Tax=Nicoliella spurrieriana TaxID=2925830 RepID=A0A976X5V5_9LACO|nr:hypothetical protein [Nicoliella spurrieriana]UQS87104.1 hypothetical protein MOO44_02785 [Nicoliella spurrieriana]